MRTTIAICISLAATCGLLAACDNVRVKSQNLAPSANVGVRFEPYSAVAAGAKVTPEAVRFYAGDVDTLRRFHPTFVGDVYVDVSKQWGWEKTPEFEALVSRTATESADNGATHFILVEKGVDVHERLLTPETTETDTETTVDDQGKVHEKKVQKTKPAETVTTTTPRGRFRAYRIEPAYWSQLPVALQPKPLPGGTDVAPMPAADDAGAPGVAPGMEEGGAGPAPSGGQGNGTSL